MEVHFQSTAASTGNTIVVRSKHRDWSAVWCGADRAESGSTIHVEIEIPDPTAWSDATFADGTSTGIWDSDGTTILCGRIDHIFDDNVIALDLRPGLVLLEMVGTPPVPPPTGFLQFAPRSVSIYPTGC